MYGKAQRTQNDKQVARRDGEALLHAQQIRARRCNNNTHPNRCGHAFFEEQTEYRHNHDVKRRQKPGLAHCRKADAELLQIRGHGKCRAAQHAAHPQGLAALLSLFVRLRFFRRFALHKQQHGQKRQRGNEIAYAVKRKRTQMVHAETLRYKRRTPNKGGDRQEQGSAKLLHENSLQVVVLHFVRLARQVLHPVIPVDLHHGNEAF